MLGAASAADVPSDRCHRRIPRQHAPGSTLMSFGITCSILRFGYVWKVIVATERYTISVEILTSIAQLYEKSHMKMFAVSDLEDHH